MRHVAFHVEHLYHLPQFLPVVRELMRQHASVTVVFESLQALRRALAAGTNFHGAKTEAVEDKTAALTRLADMAPDWVVFGNTPPVENHFPSKTRTAMLYHGVGIKQVYYSPSLMRCDLRFVEGPYRVTELERLFPNGPARIAGVGFAKLDPLFDGSLTRANFDFSAAGLDAKRPTVLYAPTFYPSSLECLPRNWPLSLDGVNLIIKPHEFTLTKRRYRAQRSLLNRWEKLPGVHVTSPEQFNLLPYMAAADILVSEASSALFEFTALNRPVVWCDFYHLRLGHRGPFRPRFEKRMDRAIERFADIAAHAATPAQLTEVIRNELTTPQRLASIRRAYTEKLIGATDGVTSRRIVAMLLS